MPGVVRKKLLCTESFITTERSSSSNGKRHFNRNKYGALRHVVLDAFDKYLDCGLLLHGCARARCENCNHSELIAFSCKRRGLCPSCNTKRSLIFAEHLHEHVLLPHPHRHLVFTLPKRLRVYFKFNRELTKDLYRAAWASWQDVVQESLPGMKTGAVIALHTAGELLNFHPHLHTIAFDGAVNEDGNFHKLCILDTKKVEALFAQKVFRFLLEQELITDDVVQSMTSWEHSGFSVYAGESIDSANSDARLFLARYLKRAPLSLERITIIENGPEPIVRYTKKLDDSEQSHDFSPLEFLAELSQHIPNTWEQTTRYYGCYAARTRGAEKQKQRFSSTTPGAVLTSQECLEPKPPASRSWAQLIKRIYDVDPLICPKCNGPMKIIAFITDTKEIRKITEHLGIVPWRAPPVFQALPQFGKRSQNVKRQQKRRSNHYFPPELQV